MKSRLIVYTGPMFSGKTERLLKNLQELEELSGTKAICYKPSADTRSLFEIRSRTGKHRHAFSVDTPAMLRSLVSIQTQLDAIKPLIIAFDEAQFFEWEIIDEIINIHRTNPKVQILVAGLNLDSSGKPFAHMRDLICNATNVVVCSARCESCGREATMTYRKKGAPDNTYLVGDKEVYEPRCSRCWASGPP